MKELGILNEPFISSLDIMFLSVAGWPSKDLENFPPDMIRSLIQSEMKNEETVEKFRHILGLSKARTLDTAIKLHETTLAAA